MLRPSPNPRAQHGFGAGSEHALAAGRMRDNSPACATGPPSSMSRHGLLGDLVRDRDFLCRDKALLGPMSQTWAMSRPSVVKTERPCVTT